MINISIRDANGAPVSSIKVDAKRCTIGSQPDCHVVLQGWKVARQHAEIILRDDGMHIFRTTKLKSLRVNDAAVERYGPLTLGDTVGIGDYRLKVQLNSGTTDASDDDTENPDSLHQNARDKLYRAVSRRFASSRDGLPEEAIHGHVRQLIAEELDRLRNDDIDRTRLAREITGEFLGFGALDKLLDMPDVYEIMINAHDEIFFQTEEGIHRGIESFSNDDALLDIIRRLLQHSGRRLDEHHPMVDGRMRDGSRVNVIIPPLSTKGPSMTIRRFKTDRLNMTHLINYQTLSSPMAKFLELCVRNKRNIIIAGGTGTGKSTLLNILAHYIGEHERIVTIEDAAELHLPQPNLVSLETRSPDIEGRGGVSVRDLVRNSLRMSPDRIVIGECRGGEALDMLQAMNTGHEGSLTTIHANSPRDSLTRLEVLAQMSGMDLQINAIRHQIQSSIHILVQLTRFPCGSRKITSVCEVNGLESNLVQIGELFRFRQEGVDAEGKVLGHFEATGVIPAFIDRLRERGVKIDYAMFQ
jgi:pilus assembly protein CpaF